MREYTNRVRCAIQVASELWDMSLRRLNGDGMKRETSSLYQKCTRNKTTFLDTCPIKSLLCGLLVPRQLKNRSAVASKFTRAALD